MGDDHADQEDACPSPMVAAARAPVADPPGLTTSGSGWLRPEDAFFAFEDEEANAEQAQRNASMRDMLRQRRQGLEAQPEAAAPEEFMSVKAASGGTSSSSRPAMGGPWNADGGLAPPVASSEDRPPWFVHRPHLENTVLRLHEELLDFAEFMGHTKDELQARKRWVKTIAATCRSLWPDCQVKVFGSFSTGLSLPNGDVDVAVLDVAERPGQAMKMLADRLLSNGEISWLEIIESAKVPVCKLRQQVSGLRADVVFNQPDGIETSKFIKDRCKEYPQMKPLLIFFKYFLLQRGMHETYTGGMGSYLLCNVVLHFMQRHPSKKNPRHYAATSLGHLLFDCLKYYGADFQFDTKGICVTDGGYTFNKAERGWRGGNRRAGDGVRLCLESPLGQGFNDLGGPCFRMGVLKNLFSHALQCLSFLFVTRAGPDASLLCPMLLDPKHPVIAGRHSLMAAQPVALPGMQRSSSQLEAEGTLDSDDAASEKEAGDDDGASAAGGVSASGSGGVGGDGKGGGGAPPGKKRRRR